MTKQIYSWIQRQGHCCLHCGSWQARPSQFCKACEELLWTCHGKHLKHIYLESGIQGKALFFWKPDQDRPVSKLMKSLKLGRQQAAYDFYAETFIQRLRRHPIPKNAVLVPCPSLKNENHAEIFALSLAKILQIPIFYALQANSESGHQKGKRKQERGARRLTRLADLANQHVIFIDDILTTGSTALAARNALSPTQGFEIWCLAHRSLLAADLSL